MINTAVPSNIANYQPLKIASWMCSVVVVSSETMAVLWSCLGFVVLCVTSHLCAAFSLAQSQQALEFFFEFWGQAASRSFSEMQYGRLWEGAVWRAWHFSCKL